MAGFDNDVVYGTNVDFTGGSPVTGQMTANGQLLIGASVAPFLRANTLTAGTGIAITNGAGTITISNTGGGGGGGGTESLAGNSGSATEVGGVINVVGGTNITTTGAGQTLTISPTDNLLGLAGLAGTGYVVQTGAGTFVNRTFVAGSGISLTNASGVAGATTISASPSVPITFTEDAGSATPAANNINILGTSAQGISTSGAGSTVTITAANASAVQKGVASFDVTNFTVAAGNVTSNAITITAGVGLDTGGSVNLGGSVTLDLEVPVTVPHGGTGQITLTNHGVVIGQAASAVNVTAAGTNGQVLVAGTGVDPAFATVGGTQGVTITGGSNTISIGLVNVPNSALMNSSITINGGSGISVSGSPVSLGGSVTISASGTTVTQFTSDSGVAVPSGNNINLLGTASQGISTSAAGSTVTFTVQNASTAVKGVASFDAGDFSVSSGVVSLLGTGVGQTITGDSGGALSPTAGNWNILGGTNITTSGAGSTLTVAVDPPFAATSLTANSLILGNGTSNVSALGAATDGQLPIGNTGNPPTLATLTAGSGISITNGAGSITIANSSPGSFAPNATIQLFDDFIGFDLLPQNMFVSNLTWYADSSGMNSPNSPDTTHLGVIGNLAMTGAGNACGAYAGVGSTATGGVKNWLNLGGGAITLNWIFAINTLSTGVNRYRMRIGFGSGASSFDGTNAIVFSYQDNLNSGNWQLITTKASVSTTTNTGTAVTTGFHNAQITVNAAGTSATFTMDGVALGTIATNIPTAAITPFMNAQWAAGVINPATFYIDLFMYTQTLTSTR